MNDMVHRERVSILLEEKHRIVKTLSFSRHHGREKWIQSDENKKLLCIQTGRRSRRRIERRDGGDQAQHLEKVGSSAGGIVQGRGEIPANAIEKISRMIRTRQSNLRAV
jgi:hypothetical protein